jgi:hypothetical protein
MMVTLLVPAYQEDVDALLIPPQHNCAEAASGLDHIDRTDGSTASASRRPKRRLLGYRRSANLGKNRLIRWHGVSDRDTILSDY